MKYLSIISVCVCFFSISILGAQEICDNSIDDDGDGLIDLMDGDCLCGIKFHQEFRGDFEEFDCCPTGITQFDCLGGNWEQANDFTPDYFNMCGFMGGNGVPPVPLPLPSGQGAIGFLSCQGCHDNAGLCMPYSMLPGETYDISFYVGFNEGGGSLLSDLDVEISFFGTNSCSALPSPGEFCLSDFEDWYELGTYDVHASSQDSWEFREGTFLAVEPTEAIAIGTSCAFAADATSQYHFFDDVRISGKFFEPAEETEVEFSGDCGSGYYVTALDDSGLSYQWYLNGVAIQSGTGNPYQVPLGENGNYQVMIIYADGTCKTSEDLDVETNPYELDLDDIIIDVDCQGLDNGSITIIPNSMNFPLSFIWESGQTDAFIDNLSPGLYDVTVSDANGCIGIETYEVEEPDLLIVDIYVEQPTLEVILGYAELIIDGGVQPYTISWSNGNDDISDDTLEPGLYTVIVIDANGCEEVVMFQIFDILGAVSISIEESCANACNGTITVTEIFGGVPPYEIDWDGPVGSGYEIDELCSGFYSYIIEDAIGTTYWGDVELNPGTEIDLYFDYENVLCDEYATAPIDMTIYGGEAPLNIEWSDGSNTEDIIDASAGLYAVTVTDNAGCTASHEIEIEFSDPILVVSNIDEAPCGLIGLGAINIDITGGTPPFIFEWNTGESTEDLLDLYSGVYDLTITDDHGCEYMNTYEVTSNTDMGVSSDVNQLICNTDNNGSIILSIEGGTAPIDILWSNGETGTEINNLSEGNYEVTITDALECIWTNNISIVAQSQVNIEEQISPVVCNGESTGSINLSVSSSGNISTYAWSNGKNTKDIYDLVAGEYRLTITDEYTCTYEYIFDIKENPVFNIQETIIGVTCFEGQEGQIIIDTETPANYVFSWNNGSVDNNIINQPTGNYNLTITNDLDCDQTYEFFIPEPEEITINPIITHAGCSQGISGNILIEPSGGTAPYTYIWSNGSTIDEIQDLAGGEYLVTITDFNGCAFEDVFVVNEAVPIEIIESISNVSCFNGADGSITLNPMGGTAPFEYIWNTGETSDLIELLSSGPYSVTVTDQNDCAETLFFNLDEPSNVEVLEVIEDSKCFGEDGLINIMITGGVEPYILYWNTGENTNQISGTAGSYEVEVIDNNGCINVFNYTITEPEELNADIINSVDPSQIGDNGTAEILITGGTSPYDVQWSNGATGTIVDNLSFGINTATIIDANGCETIVEIDYIPEQLSYVYTIEENDCFEACIAVIDLEIAGGQEPYYVQWSNGSVGAQAMDLCAGNYNATITDALGNSTETAFITILNPDKLTVSYQLAEISCVDIDDGKIELTPSGGTGPYNYLWNTNDSNNRLENLSPGIYDVTISDANQCRILETYEIKELIELDVQLTPIKAPCESEFGSIQVDGTDLLDTEFIIDGQSIGFLTNGIINHVSVGQHDVSYMLNEDCEMSLGQIGISKSGEVNLSVTPSNIEAKLDEAILVELDIDLQEPAPTYFIEWISENPIICNEYDASSACVSIELIAIQSGVLSVEYMDENGCVDWLDINIRVIDPPVINLPNIFSPNGDGENETFKFLTSRKVQQVKTFAIYDRWGGVMHLQENEITQSMLWDGKRSGKDVSPGVYIYLIELEMIDGTQARFTGDLTLVK